MKSFSSGSIPPVSTMRSFRPLHSASPYRRSRVMPGSSPTIARREPTMRLKSVDLPTLGRPTIAIIGIVVSAANERTGELCVDRLNEICSEHRPSRAHRLKSSLRSMLAMQNRYYRDFCAFLVSACVVCTPQPPCNRRERHYSSPIFRSRWSVVADTSSLRIPAWTIANGPSCRAGFGRNAAPDRRSGHRDGQDSCLSRAGDSIGQARHHLNGNEESAGTAFLQRRTVPRAGALSRSHIGHENVGLLHEGSQ